MKFHNTTVKGEIFAGIAMFLAMSYILVVCPSLLSQTGMDYNAVFLSTVFVTGTTTIISAFYTKLPIALAPGLGMTTVFLSLATGPEQMPWRLLVLATYMAGVLICIFIRFGVYDKIIVIMDGSFRRMIMSGVGFALFLYGISTTGLLKKMNGIYVPGQLQLMPVVICVISLGVLFIMKHYNKKSFVLAGILTAYVLSVCLHYYEAYQYDGVTVRAYLKNIFAVSYNIRDIRKVMFSFPDIGFEITDMQRFSAFINAVFVFCMGHFFDAIGTNTSAFDAIFEGLDERMKDTVSLKRAITVDGIGNVVSGLLGTPTVTTYAESMVGIVSGGKTGITALTTGCMFLLCFLFAPLFTSMEAYVAAPALIYVGWKLAMRYREFDRKRIAVFVFGIGLIFYIGMTFQVAKAVVYGLLIYTLLVWITEKKKPVSGWWIMLIFAAIQVVLGLAS